MSLTASHGWRAVVASLLALAMTSAGTLLRDDNGTGRQPAVMEGTVIVKFRTPADAGKMAGSALFQRLEVAEITPFLPAVAGAVLKSASLQSLASLQRVRELHYREPVPPRVAAAWLAQDPSVEYAEPRYLYTIDDAAAMEVSNMAWRRPQKPNDPQYSSMSHLVHVGLPEAWDLVKASDGSVMLAIVDGGTEWRHADLIGNVWYNPGEVENGVDDDGNGYTDDVHGWNFANSTNDPTGLSGTPNNGRHGTIVAGVAAAVTDNDVGIAGASWNARFLPVNAACPSTDNAICFGYDGIAYAALMGAEVINVSWGGPDSFLGRDVIKAVTAAGSLVVVSAGNNGGVSGQGGNIDINPGYPASYDGVLVVGATGKTDDAKARFSNYGLSVDVFAPGVAIESTTPGNTYTSQASGTSFSTPLVSALAALIKTHRPALTMAQVREQIRVTSDDIDASNPNVLHGLLGHGRINAVRALTTENLPAVRIRAVEIEDSGGDGAVQNGETVDVTLELTNFLANARNLSLSLSSPDTTVTLLDDSHFTGLLESGALTRARFSFRMASDAPLDYPLRFALRATAEGYDDAEFFALTANRATHRTGLVEVSITDEGNIGWSDFQGSSSGKGFRFFGVDWLYEGGLMLATGPTRISDSVRNTVAGLQDKDLVREQGSFFGVLDANVTSEIGVVNLTDAAAASPIGLKVHQESYADSTDATNDFVVVRYIISHANPGSVTPIDNIYVGLFTDWDLTNGGDYARYDASRRLGRVQSSANNPLVAFGVKLLTTSAGVSYRSIDNKEIYDSRSGGNGFTNAEKWSFMSGGIQKQSVDNEDVSTLITAGPYRLNPGGTVEAAFALIAATGDEQLAEYADEAQDYWDRTLRFLVPSTVSTEADPKREAAFSFEEPFPNPTTSSASLAFRIGAPGAVEISIFDILGRQVRTLAYEASAPGRHIVSWDGRNQQGGLVSNGLYLCQIEAQTSEGAFAASQRIIVVR